MVKYTHNYRCTIWPEDDHEINGCMLRTQKYWNKKKPTEGNSYKWKRSRKTEKCFGVKHDKAITTA